MRQYVGSDNGRCCPYFVKRQAGWSRSPGPGHFVVALNTSRPVLERNDAGVAHAYLFGTKQDASCDQLSAYHCGFHLVTLYYEYMLQRHPSGVYFIRNGGFPRNCGYARQPGVMRVLSRIAGFHKRRAYRNLQTYFFHRQVGAKILLSRMAAGDAVQVVGCGIFRDQAQSRQQDLSAQCQP